MRPGAQVPNDRRGLVAGLGARHAVLRLPAGHQARDLHARRHRELEHAIAQDHQDARLFPSDEAAIKPLWLALRNVRAKSVRATFDWKVAMNHFAILFGERVTATRG